MGKNSTPKQDEAAEGLFGGGSAAAAGASEDRLQDSLKWALFQIDLAIGVGRDARKPDNIAHAVGLAHEVYREGLAGGSGGREGIIAALGVITQVLLTMHPPFPESGKLIEVLWEAQRALEFAAKGIRHSALTLRAPKHRPPDPARHEFAVRCVMALRACRDAEHANPESDVCKAANDVAKKYFKKEGRLTKATLCRWGRHYDKEAADREGNEMYLLVPRWLVNRHGSASDKREHLKARAKLLLECLSSQNAVRPISSVAHEGYWRLGPATPGH